jgi:hypothetical protein
MPEHDDDCDCESCDDRNCPDEAFPRELHCERCDSEYVVWFAPNAIWNLVVREHTPIGRREPFLCPTCFTVLAESRGVKVAWMVAPEDTELSGALIQIDRLTKQLAAQAQITPQPTLVR